MTDTTIALKQYLINIGLEGDADFLREGVQLLPQRGSLDERNSIDIV